MRRPVLLILAVLLYSIAFGQSNGDYRSRQTGNWNINATWEKYQGGIWISPSTDFPVMNNIIKKITIQNGHTVSATGNLRATAAAANITINQGGALNMSTYTIRGNASQGNKFPTIIINGTLNSATSVTSSTFTVGSTGTFITSYTGTNGWWNGNTRPTTVTLTGTMQYTGAAGQKVPLYTHTNIIIGGSGAKILVGTIIINGLLAINVNATLNMAAYTLTLNGSGILLNGVLQNSNGTLTFGGVTQTISGTGSFSGTFANINIGTITKSNTTLSVTGQVITNNLRIDKSAPNTGSLFTIGSSSRMQVRTSLDIFINNGLLLKSDVNNTASLIAAATGLNGGTSNVSAELFLTGTEGGVMYHYISPPVVSAPATIFSSVNVLNVSKYKESLITTDKGNGWVAYDGWHYNSTSEAWENLGASESWPDLIAGNGYDYYSSTDRTFVFQGRLNTSNTPVTLYYNSAGVTPSPYEHGFNLAGNPFSCGLDWDAVVAANNIWNDVGAAIYFTRNGRTYSYVNGITVPDDFGDGRYIPPMQGFFVKSTLNNVTLNIPASARIHTSHARYKSAFVTPMIRVEAEGAGKSDQAVITFDDKATDGFDSRFDSQKFSKMTGAPYIAVSAAGNDFVIDGLPFPTDSTEIDLKFNAPTGGNYVISAREISGLSDYTVYLNDKMLNNSQDLSQTRRYEFTSDAGSFPGRFTISFTKRSVKAVPEYRHDKGPFTLFTASGYLNIRADGKSWDGVSAEIRVYEMTGRMMVSAVKHEFMEGEQVQIPFGYPMGIYIVEITSKGKRFTGKFINR